jgi:hypothetical protein
LSSSSARLLVGQTPKFELLLDEHGAGVQSHVSAESTQQQTQEINDGGSDS